MQLLIKQPTIIAPESPYHLQKRDLFIEDGIIKSIEPTLKITGIEVMDAHNDLVSIGWMDIGVQIGEPGLEHQEDLQSVTKAASAGGFTAIASFPNTDPTVHTRSEVNYLKSFSNRSIVDIKPLGAISKNGHGKDLTEFYDMKAAGAVGFSDGKYSLQHTGLLIRALQYAKGANSLILNHPNDLSIAHGGQMNEGSVSTALGLPGIPTMAEELMLQRDLEVLAYTGGQLHAHNISTRRSVNLIRTAKQKGLNVTASVAIMNLVLTDESLYQFDTNYKVQPPLRTQDDIDALIGGILDGTIDCITSNHVPIEQERKMLEFTYADPGAISLETAYALSNECLSRQLDVTGLVELWAYKSRNILRLPTPKIEVNAVANLTIFNPDEVWQYKENHIQSKSKNSPFIGRKMKGKVKGIINNGQKWFNNLT